MLPDGIDGRLFLHSMPGRREDLEEARRCIAEQNIERIVSLAPLDEIQVKSPSYADAITSGTMRVDLLPVEDYGVPDDRDAFLADARSVAVDLKAGKNVLVHCGAGIGRTGTFACCVLLQFGIALDKALQDVKAAGSSAETDDQRRLLRWCAKQLAPQAHGRQ
jgi:protein-tyrosine phosphatase